MTDPRSETDLPGLAGPEPASIFISYSHEDATLREELEKHLASLTRQKLVDVWHDRRISAGEEWRGKIDDHLDSARVVVLLVSADFIASDYCIDKEMTSALQRHKAGSARVIPVIVRPCDWQGTPFAELLALPIGARPVTEWESRDAAWLNVVKGIGEAIGLVDQPFVEPSSHETTPQPPLRATTPRKKRRTAVWLAAVFAAMLLVSSAIPIVTQWLREPAIEVVERPTVDKANGLLTIAVLGFAPLEPDPGTEWLAMALEEILATQLRAHRRILVPDGSWAAEIRRTSGPTGQLGENDLARLRADRRPALADTVVTGLWEITGEQLSLRLDLRDLKTGAEQIVNVTGRAQDLSTLGQAAARKIEVYLGLAAFSLEGARAAAKLIPDEVEALELYAKGLAAWRMGKTLEARRHLMAALEIEPEHPMLHLIYGEILWHLGYTKEAATTGSNALTRVNRLTGTHRLDVTARSYRLLGEWDAALTACEQLLVADPDEMAYRLLQAEIWDRSDVLAKEERSEALDAVAALRSEARGVFRARAEMVEARLRLDAGEIELAKERALQAVATGSSTGVISLQAQGRLLEAAAHQLLGELEEARAALKAAQRLYEHLDYPRRVHDVFLGQAIASAQTGDLEKALQMFEDYLGILAEHDDPLNEAIVNVNLANVYIYLGKLEEAEARVQAALEVLPKCGTPREVAQAHVILGNVYYYMGRLGPTRKSYEQALETFRAIGDRERIARSLANLGEVLILSGDLLYAESKYVAALTINRELGNKSGEANDLFSLGQIAVQRYDAKKAQSYFEQSWELAKELGDLFLQGYIRREQARLALVEARVAEAARLAGEAVSIFDKNEDEKAVAQAVQAWTFLERQPPDLERALELGAAIQSRAVNSQNRTVRFEAELLIARLDALGGADVWELVDTLEALAKKSNMDGYVLDAFAARLILGDIEMQGEFSEGRDRLEALRSAAKARGLKLFEQRAGSLLTP